MSLLIHLFLRGLLELFSKTNEEHKQKSLQVKAETYYNSLDSSTKEDLEKIDNMDGHDFEHFVAHILKQNGYSNVKVTSGSNDFGVDILANKDADHYAIQVKRQEAKVSRRAVSDAVAGQSHYGCNKSMVITNSYMSKSGFKFAESTDCIIMDRDEFITLVDNTNSLIDKNSLKKNNIPILYKDACEKCGGIDYEYNLYWDEFICTQCGWSIYICQNPKEKINKSNGSAMGQDSCKECGGIDYEYNSYWNEYVCKQCGWKVSGIRQ